MNFLKFPLGYQGGGQIVEADLSGVESDVFLVDDSNLRSFESGSDFRYFGGHFKQSPVRLQIPSPGSWIAVVIPGLGGTVSASVRVLN